MTTQGTAAKQTIRSRTSQRISLISLVRNILVSFCLILFTRCVQSGIDDITSDDAWALYLDELNEAIWPNGKLREETKKPRSEIEKSQTRKVAVQALMDAFPGTCTCK